MKLTENQLEWIIQLLPVITVEGTVEEDELLTNDFKDLEIFLEDYILYIAGSYVAHIARQMQTHDTPPDYDITGETITISNIEVCDGSLEVFEITDKQKSTLIDAISQSLIF